MVYLQREALVQNLIDKDQHELFTHVELKRDLKVLREDYSPVHYLTTVRYIGIMKFNNAIGVKLDLVRSKRENRKHDAID